MFYKNTINKIGIIGGGQLGKMMILEAKKMGFYCLLLDPNPSCPASGVCDYHIVAGFNDKKAIRDLSEKSDVITYEFEHINSDILITLENEGCLIYPTAKSLQIIQNKFTQKTLLHSAGIPVGDFMEVSCTNDLYNAATAYGYPFLLKAATGGYDGKGNALIKNKSCLLKSYEEMKRVSTAIIAERFIHFEKEISILACRDIKGNIKVYPVAENFHEDNILIKTVVPASISVLATKKAEAIAYQAMSILNGVGMFCVELFYVNDEEIYLNEVAPRPHNSGHYTIEACKTSQFMQHILAITGLPLNSSSLHTPCIMYNVLGGDKRGKPIITGVLDALKMEGVYFHFYGKTENVPKRKMGHITVLKCDDDYEMIAQRAYEGIKIDGQDS